MKNKTLALSLALIGMLAPTPIEINKWEIADPPQGYEKINLQGH